MAGKSPAMTRGFCSKRSRHSTLRLIASSRPPCCPMFEVEARRCAPPLTGAGVGYSPFAAAGSRGWSAERRRLVSAPWRGCGAPFGERALRRPALHAAFFRETVSFPTNPGAALAHAKALRLPRRPASSSRAARSGRRAGPRGSPGVRLRAAPAGAAPAPSAERLRKTPLASRCSDYYPSILVLSRSVCSPQKRMWERSATGATTGLRPATC
jgi:hypothetical protein